MDLHRILSGLTTETWHVEDAVMLQDGPDRARSLGDVAEQLAEGVAHRPTYRRPPMKLLDLMFIAPLWTSHASAAARE